MNIQETITEIHNTAREKGFWDNERNFGELLMLITSELGEALEAHRKKRFANMEKYTAINAPIGSQAFKLTFEETIKDTVEDELADAVIRLFDLAGGLDIDLEQHIRAKMEYNKTRERLHGKAY